MPRRSRSEALARTVREPHEVLGLSPCETDAVKVIEVAQMLLGRWRRVPLEEPAAERERCAREARNRIRQIVAAREAMLERIHAGRRGR